MAVVLVLIKVFALGAEGLGEGDEGTQALRFSQRVHPTPYTLHPHVENPTPYTLHPKPEKPDPKPEALGPEPQTLTPQPKPLQPAPSSSLLCYSQA